MSPKGPEPAIARAGRPRWYTVRPRDVRIRTKLAALLMVPIIAVVGLAVTRLAAGADRANDAGMVTDLSVLSADVSALAHLLHRERMVAMDYLSDPAASMDAYLQRTQATDRGITAYRDQRRQLTDAPASAARSLDRIDSRLPSLASVRREVAARQDVSSSKTVLQYGLIIDDLVAYRQELDRATQDNELAASLRAVAAFSKAKEQVANEQADAFLALNASGTDTQPYSAFLASLIGQQEAFVTFSLTARQQQRAIVDSTITGDAVDLADRAAEELRRAVGQRPDIPAAELSRTIGAVVDLMRVAEDQLDQAAIHQARQQRSAVLAEVGMQSAGVLAALLLAIAIAVLIARAMVRSLARLSTAALAVADHELPEVVAKLQSAGDPVEGTVEQIVEQAKDPIPVTGRDEFGQVASAFNAVHHSAVRIAAEQAALRASISTMFLNLARRSQSIVDRMIGELDQVEHGESDPTRLARLFQLDHLAVRMRRNDENLLVLAGADSSPPRHEHAALADVIRAAQSEIERYERVEISILDEDVSVVSHAVNDVVRLLAELLDNATRFSPPDTVAVVDATVAGDSAVLQVTDRGLGLSDDQLASFNARLSAADQNLHLADVRMLGLAVVNKLAARNGIVVTLGRNFGAGTIAEVRLPNALLILPPPVQPRRSFPAATPQAGIPGQRTAQPEHSGTPIAGRPTSGAPIAGRPTSGAGAQSGPPIYWPAYQSEPGADGAPAQPTGRPVAPAQVNGRPMGYPSPDRPSAASAVPMPIVGGQTSDAMALPALASAGPRPVGSEPFTVSVSAAETAEMPIFRETAAGWFETHSDSTFDQNGPDQVPEPVVPPQARRVAAEAPVLPDPVVTGPSWRQPVSVDGPEPETDATGPEAGGAPWATAADDGWKAAAAIATPQTAGTTRSGLMRRVPAANLVPGGVEPVTRTTSGRRTPERVRGRLAAYHRGLQRGRAAVDDVGEDEAFGYGGGSKGTEEAKR